MEGFRYCHPIDVRYGDLDPQGHVNNANYLTYLEQARVSYIRELGLWDGRSFLEIGFILADVHIQYRAPILFGHQVQVGVRISRLGNKSLTMNYRIEDSQTGEDFANATTIQVAYDYRQRCSIPLPDQWRKTVSQYEGIDQFA